ncbi:MAG: hypothetical protein D4R84_17875 [Rhodocyclaceae bacterium]|nr:MAG: hypothetical protein D4R84_17875 [Rhodocyclaceae bacterium]
MVKAAHADEIVRLSVKRAGRKTSVSMDAYLANAMMRHLDGDLAVLRDWAQRRVDLLETEWEAQASGKAVGDRVRVQSGISRLVQREMLRELLERPAGKRLVAKQAAR